MRSLLALLWITSLTALSSGAMAETVITITSPKNGATLRPNGDNVVHYTAVLEGDDDHFFLYLDDQKIQLLRRLEGQYTFDKLPLGKHKLCIKAAYKDHLLTGVENCIEVLVVSGPTINYGNPPDQKNF